MAGTVGRCTGLGQSWRSFETQPVRLVQRSNQLLYQACFLQAVQGRFLGQEGWSTSRPVSRRPPLLNRTSAGVGPWDLEFNNSPALQMGIARR